MWGERIALGLVAAIALASTGYSLRYFHAELPDATDEAEAATGGNAERGRAAVERYGCTACHRVPGIASAQSLVGPPLDGFARKLYVAGSLPNTADNLIEWIQHPTRLREHTAMPETGIGDEDARNVAAFLYSRQ